MVYQVEPGNSLPFGSYTIKNEFELSDIIGRFFTVFYNQSVEQEKINQLVKDFLEKQEWVLNEEAETKYGIPTRPLKHINQIRLFDVPEGLEMIFHANYLTSELYGTFIMNTDNQDGYTKISEVKHIKRDIFDLEEVCRV